MSETTDTERVTLEALAAVSGMDASELGREKDLVADLGIDSPKALRLLVRLEDELGVEISDDEAAALVTVGDVVDFVRQHGGDEPVPAQG